MVRMEMVKWYMMNVKRTGQDVADGISREDDSKDMMMQLSLK